MPQAALPVGVNASQREDLLRSIERKVDRLTGGEECPERKQKKMMRRHAGAAGAEDYKNREKLWETFSSKKLIDSASHSLA